MAKKLHEEDIKLNIIVGNNAAQRKIDELQKATRDLKIEQEQLYKIKNRLEAQGKKESAEYKNVTARLKELNKEIRNNNARVKHLTGELGLNGMTMQQLSRRAKDLRRDLYSAVPGTQKWKELNKELTEVSNRLAVLRNRANQQSLTWSSAANWLNKYQTMLVGFAATVTGVTLTFQKWLDYSGKLADQQANVRKTTGMTKEEIDELTRSVADLDTRTSRMDLLKIAEEGGRIGLAKEEIHGFVRVMDQAVVALGDTFTGGVEEVASVLGKLRFLFEETAEMGVEEAYLSIGSALNELGANGVATERNIAEFATRLGSLPKQLKPTVAEALALGASFEESGIKAEIASRAYSIFMNRAAQNTGEFAKVMGMTTEEARNLLNTNPTEFFLQFGEALGKSNVSATQMSKMLQDMGINADGANKIVGAISNNVHRFRDQMKLSNKALVEATSLTQEFEVKNQNLQGTLDKVQKKLAAIFTSQDIMEWLENAVNWFAKVIGAIDDAEGTGKKWREGLVLMAKIVTVLVAAMVSYNGAVKLNAIWTARARKEGVLWAIHLRLQNAIAALYITRIGLATAAKALFTKGVRASIVELRTLISTLGMTPWGVFAAGVGILVSAWALFVRNQKEVITNQKILDNAFLEAEKNIAANVNQIERLLKVAQDQEAADSKRIKAINELNNIIPELNNQLSLETINTLEATNAIKAHTEALRKDARVQALHAKLVDLEGQKLDVEAKTSKDYRSKGDSFFARAIQKTDKVSDAIWGFFGVDTEYHESIEELTKKLRDAYPDMEQGKFESMLEAAIKQSGLDKKAEELANLEQQIEFISETLTDLKLDKTGNNHVVVEDIDLSSSSKESDKAKKDRERRIEELKRENERLANELLQIRRSYEDADLALQESSFDKELQQLEIQHKRRVEDLKAQIVDESTITALEREKAQAKGDAERVKLIDEMISKLKEKNTELQNSILQSEITFEHQRNRLRVKYANERITNLQKEFEDRQKLREQEINQELIDLGTVEAVKERLRDSLSKKELDSIKTWEDAKRALRKEYQEDEIEDEINHYTNLMHELQNAWESGMVDGIEIELLTDEEKEKFLSQINEIKQKLIELGILKADLQNQTSSEDYSGSYGSFGSVDILGLSQEDWQRFIDNVNDGIFELQELAAVVGMLQNAFAQYYAYVQAQERRNLDLFERSVNRRRDSLKRQLDSGILSHEEYDKKMQDLEEKAEKRRAEMEYKAAMQQYRQSIMNAISGTALMIINAAQTKPFVPAGLAMASVASIMGAIQLATIRQNKPIKGYEKGLYNNELFDVIREQDGKKFKASYGGETKTGVVKTPTVFMAGERGPEMIIDNEAFSRFHPDLKRDLYREIARVKGFESGLYRNPTGIDESSKAIENLLIQNNMLMEQNNSLLTTLTEIYGRTELVLDYEAIRKIKKVEDEYNNHQNKNRV